MSQVLKQGLSQKLLQKLSPQQIQLIKLLQVPTAQIEQRVQDELEENPALEEGEEEAPEELEEAQREEEDPVETAEDELDNTLDDDFDLTDYMADDQVADYKMNNYSSRANEEEADTRMPPVVTETFHDYLTRQLGMLKLSDREEKLSKQIIGSIDEDGYLRRSLTAIADDLAFTEYIKTDKKELKNLLEQIQEFEPPGVGARSLQECLLLQLARKAEKDEYDILAEKLLDRYFDAFTKKQYDYLQKQLGIETEVLKEILNHILKLNPKPGAAYSDKYSKAQNQQYIIPDFIVTNNNGELQMKLNGRNAPELHISPDYRHMLKGYKASKKHTKKQKEAVLFIKQKIDGAKWFIEAIKQRQETLLKTMRAIMEYQYNFFLTGDEGRLKPMILKDIAGRTGLDISTISRVVNNKYVQTEFGTFLLKYFFSEGMKKEDGEDISTREIKQVLKEIIHHEDKYKPYSDQKLTSMLADKGYRIARRTVAKYREQLDLPVARLRKEI